MGPIMCLALPRLDSPHPGATGLLVKSSSSRHVVLALRDMIQGTNANQDELETVSETPAELACNIEACARNRYFAALLGQSTLY